MANFRFWPIADLVGSANDVGFRSWSRSSRLAELSAPHSLLV